MLCRRLQRSVRRALLPLPLPGSAVPLVHPLARCFAAAAAPSSSDEPQQEQWEEDGGAQFVTDDASYPRRRPPQPESLSEASGSFQRGGGSSSVGGHSILPPRPRGGGGQGSQAGSGRADDPATRNLIARMNTFHIKTAVDASVPVGSHHGAGAAGAGGLTEGDRVSAAPGGKVLPRKGGRPIHPADMIEQRGKLTPMQLHRVLSSLQQSSSEWGLSAAAAAYDVDPALLSSTRSALSLPFVAPSTRRERGFWEGGPEEPVAVQLQRSLGQEVQRVRILGEHLRIDREQK